MIALRKTETDFLVWCTKLVPKARRDLQDFADCRLNVHTDREIYNDATTIIQQLTSLNYLLDRVHRDFLNDVLVGGKSCDKTPITAELRREVYAAWCKICFPGGTPDEQTINNEVLGAALRDTRKERGFRISHVAKLIGIDKKTLYAYEAGRCQIRLEALYRLSKLYDFSIDELLEYRGVINR